MSEEKKSWYVLQFKPNAHKIAQRNLNQQKFETFLPLEEITKCQNKKFISSKRPLFPGYMFVSFDKEKNPWNKINSTFGVSKLLIFNYKPCVVPQTIIANIMSQCNSDGTLLPPKQFYKGDSVRLNSGPFNNFLAIIDSIEENQRIWVLINLIGKETRALVNTKKISVPNKILNSNNQRQ